MKKLISLIVLVVIVKCSESARSCPGHSTLINNHCYIEVVDPMTFSNARKYCKLHHTGMVHAAVISNRYRLKDKSQKRGYHWSGQLNGRCRATDIHTGKTISGTPCGDKRPFYCVGYSAKSLPKRIPRCQAGWKKTGNGAMCVKVFEGNPNHWHGSRETCKKFRGDLVAVRDLDISNDIKGVMGKSRYWIGLHDKNHDGTFSWLEDNEGTKFTNFRYKPRNILGNEYCVELIGNHDGKWNDKPCHVMRDFICQKKPQ